MALKMQPMGLQLARSATEMPSKPAPSMDWKGVLPTASQVKQAAAETGQRAGDDHRQYDVLFGADACVHGGVSVVAAGLSS